MTLFLFLNDIKLCFATVFVFTFNFPFKRLPFHVGLRFLIKPVNNQVLLNLYVITMPNDIPILLNYF